MKVLKVLECEIEEKNSIISKCEEKILNVEQEVSDIFVMLRTSLSEIEYIDNKEINNNVVNSQNGNIILQTKATVSNVNLLIKFLETERKELQKQLDLIKSEKGIESDCAGNFKTNISSVIAGMQYCLAYNFSYTVCDEPFEI